MREDGKLTRETLADKAKEWTSIGSMGSADDRFQSVSEAYHEAEQQAPDRAEQAAGKGEARVTADFAAAPRSADFGPRMWEIVQEAPRSPAAFDALLWIIGHSLRFHDDPSVRSVVLGNAVDALIRDHLDDVGDRLADRNVAEAFGMGGSIAAPHVDRLCRALFERGRTPETRGRMGLKLAQHIKAEAELVESLAVRGDDSSRRPELAIWGSDYLATLRRMGRDILARKADLIFEQVKSKYVHVK